MVDSVGSTGCDTAANVHQTASPALQCYCWSGYNTASSTSIQYIAKVGKKRTSTAVFEEITLKHYHFANAIYNSPKVLLLQI